LALLAEHQPNANLWRITCAFPEIGINDNPVDQKEVWKAVGGYANRVAGLVDLSREYKAQALLPKLEGEPSSEASAEGDDDEATCSDDRTKGTSAESPVDDASSPSPEK
jgi:hypothetical protein